MSPPSRDAEREPGPVGNSPADDLVVIGGACGAWGDSSFASTQLLDAKRCDYIIFEALAEITMGILSRAQAKNPNAGFAIDVIEVIGRDIAQCISQGVRVITNAGGLNPRAAAARLRAIANEAGVELSIATIEGDDLMPELERLAADGYLDDKFRSPLSVNAYLGAQPIAAALAAGANVVITGRCVDSALALGPLLHEFGWSHDDYDRLSQGSLAGHLLECGPQSTGGLLTDWEDLESWEDIGYPIAECHRDGSFVVTKPEQTGGLVDVRSVSEQLLYEIADPSAYCLPDVTCDWRSVRVAMAGDDRVSVSNARGIAPPLNLKAIAQVSNGYRIQELMMVAGRNAVQKAERLASDMLRRAARVLERAELEPIKSSDVEVLGAECTYGDQSRTRNSREVILKLSLQHNERSALERVVREMPSFGLATPGLSGGGRGLARPSASMQLATFFVPRDYVVPKIALDGKRVPHDEPQGETTTELAAHSVPRAEHFAIEDGIDVPLIAIAHGRSGDKGPDANIGIRARHPDFVPLLRAQLTAEAVRSFFAHRMRGEVLRFELPGIDAFNFVLKDALGGGGAASLRFDAQGKAYAQQLLDRMLSVPRAWLRHEAFHIGGPGPRSRRG